MEKDMNTDNLTKSVQTFSTRYLEEYSRAMQVYADLLSNIAKSGRDGVERDIIGSVDPQSRYAEFVVAQAPKVFARLSEAGIDYYTTVANLGMQTLNGYVEKVLQVDEPAKSRTAKSKARKSAPKKVAKKAAKKAVRKAPKKKTRK